MKLSRISWNKIGIILSILIMFLIACSSAQTSILPSKTTSQTEPVLSDKLVQN
jgi:hypothetical protein